MRSGRNEFFKKFEAAIGNKDLDTMMELMHPDWTMVMHSTGKVLDLNDWKEMFSKIIAGDNFRRENVRCIYENDDIMVSHSIATFPNGTTDAVMYVGILKDGKLFRTETGSTPINK
ncbi:MAG TPA: nuclear transport factor 2 family protein [Arenicellales bacterium]|nr:nuclear transport factor 2 family protein [Arenicellales bacterium]